MKLNAVLMVSDLLEYSLFCNNSPPVLGRRYFYLHSQGSSGNVCSSCGGSCYNSYCSSSACLIQGTCTGGCISACSGSGYGCKSCGSQCSTSGGCGTSACAVSGCGAACYSAGCWSSCSSDCWRSCTGSCGNTCQSQCTTICGYTCASTCYSSGCSGGFYLFFVYIHTMR